MINSNAYTSRGRRASPARGAMIFRRVFRLRAVSGNTARAPETFFPLANTLRRWRAGAVVRELCNGLRIGVDGDILPGDNCACKCGPPYLDNGLSLLKPTRQRRRWAQVYGWRRPSHCGRTNVLRQWRGPYAVGHAGRSPCPFYNCVMRWPLAEWFWLTFVRRVY